MHHNLAETLVKLYFVETGPALERVLFPLETSVSSREQAWRQGWVRLHPGIGSSDYRSARSERRSS